MPSVTPRRQRKPLLQTNDKYGKVHRSNCAGMLSSLVYKEGDGVIGAGEHRQRRCILMGGWARGNGGSGVARDEDMELHGVLGLFRLRILPTSHHSSRVGAMQGVGT